jgi:hypothetical protein
VATDLETLLTALYVKIDDEIAETRRMGGPPRLSDSELVCLAVAQVLLGYRSEARWLRFARKRLVGLFPYLPQQSGYNKRLRAARPLVKRTIRELAVDSDFWFDNHWITDSTPVPCGMSRPTAQRSNLAGWAGYGYCASHSRFFWGLRLYLVCTPTGIPIMWPLANPKIGEREVLATMLEVDAGLVAQREATLLISDKGFASKSFEKALAERGIDLLRPSRKREKQRYGEPMSRRSANSSSPSTTPSEGNLTHGGRTFEGVAIRVAQRILAMATGIWHNNKIGAPVTRSLIAYDH